VRLNAFDDARMKFDIRFFVAICSSSSTWRSPSCFPGRSPFKASASSFLVDDGVPAVVTIRLRLRVEEGSARWIERAFRGRARRSGILDPPHGRPVGRTILFRRPQRGAVRQGFLVTAADDSSPGRAPVADVDDFGLACCAVEMSQMSMPRYDAERSASRRAPPPPVRRLMVAGS